MGIDDNDWLHFDELEAAVRDDGLTPDEAIANENFRIYLDAHEGDDGTETDRCLDCDADLDTHALNEHNPGCPWVAEVLDEEAAERAA